MRATFLPFSKPSLQEWEIKAVEDVLRSGWITTGPKNAEFEQKFCEYVGASHAVPMTSETAVMFALLRAIDLKPGDEVVSPSMTWVSLPNAVSLFGARVSFADCDRDTLMSTPEMLEAAVTPRTKLIVPVHFAGSVVELDRIRDFAERRGIMLVEDAAHALGAEFKGERIGKRGTCMFSFHPIKNITTGEGGMLATPDKALADRVRSLKFHGLGVDAYDRQTNNRAPQAQVVEPGYKFNMPDMQAVLGVTQLSRVEEMNRRRAEICALYMEKLASVPELMPLAEPSYEHKHCHHLMIVRLDVDKAGIGRDEFMEALKKENIGTGLHFRCVHRQKYYREAYDIPDGALPNTEWNSDRIFSLPLFPEMTEDDVNDAIDACKKILNERH